jgi:hypothetical protein
MSGPRGAWKSTGFQQGNRRLFWSGVTPVATSTGADQAPPLLSLREYQMPTSSSPSSLPPKNATARLPSGSWTIVEAWQEGKDAFS